MLKKSALKTFLFFLLWPNKLEIKLERIFSNKNIRINRICFLKTKQIFNNHSKVVSVIELKNNLPKKAVLEIYDNKYFFERNLFALSFLGKVSHKIKIRVPKIYGYLRSEKAIIREFVEGEFLHILIEKKELTIKEIKSVAKEISYSAAKIHSLHVAESNNFLVLKLNRKIENFVFKKIRKFIKPNIATLKPAIFGNIRILLKKAKELEKKNSISLIHGDYQPANFVLQKNRLFLTDFDTLEIGNPAKDLGMFLFQLDYFMEIGKYRKEEIKEIKELFLKNYLRYKKIDFYPDFETNVNCYQAQMVEYIIAGMTWGESKPRLKDVDALLKKQTKFLS